MTIFLFFSTLNLSHLPSRVKNQAETDYFREKLSAVKESEQYGWCRDKFELSLQVVRENRGEFMSRPNAFAHIMEMKN
jgi:predicted 3-demethylubiquinone-9 3-methyltransferase (glyoxalase superfamily)